MADIQTAQSKVDNTPLSPVQRGEVRSWGTVTNVEVKGPLSSLQNNPYNPTSIAYPKDLDSFDKGHAIQFNIRDIKPFKTNAEEILNYTKQKFSELQSGVSSVYHSENKVETLSNIGGSMLGRLGNGAINTQPETVDDKLTTIRLYMPDTLSFEYQAQYDKLSLAEAINSTPVVGKISTAITSMVNNNAAKLIGKKLGYTFNPQQQMLFEGIDFREFELQFTFTPVSPDEAANVREIIRLFKRAAAPTKQTGLAGFFWKPPSVFDLGFFFNGVPNPNVPPVLRCALQSVDVNYAPNGWSALSDGAPVQTTMSLSFREIELLDRDMIDELENRVKT